MSLALVAATMSARAATNTFADLSLGPGGVLIGQADDMWQIGGAFDNGSTNPLYNVLASTFEFVSTTGQTLEQAGRDRGPRWSALTNNWGFGTIRLMGATVTVVDNQPNSAGSDAVYAAALAGTGTLNIGPGMVFYYGATSGWSGVVNVFGGGVFRPLLDDAGDADGDNVKNGNECECGTDPTNALSVLKITALGYAGSDANVAWTTVGGKSYRLQAAPTLMGNPATNFVSVSAPLTAAGSGESTTNLWLSGGMTNASPRLFRVILSP
jgi:hypothetical protein